MTPEPSLSLTRLYVLRAMYALISIGLAVTVWPILMRTFGHSEGPHSVVNVLIGTFGLASLLGLRYPIAMLPLLVFELAWKTLWVVCYGLPGYLRGDFSTYDQGVFGACVMGVVLTSAALPWGYLYRRYVRANGDRWR